MYLCPIILPATIAVIDYDACARSGFSSLPYKVARMIRWTLTIFLAVIVFSSLLPWLEKVGIGRLPGDLRFTLFGRKFLLPFASTVLLSILVVIIGKLLH